MPISDLRSVYHHQLMQSTWLTKLLEYNCYTHQNTNKVISLYYYNHKPADTLDFSQNKTNVNTTFSSQRVRSVRSLTFQLALQGKLTHAVSEWNTYQHRN